MREHPQSISPVGQPGKSAKEAASAASGEAAAGVTSGGTGGASLLGPGDPPPLRWLNPQSEGRALFTCDHAGCAVPSVLGWLGLDEATLQEHIGWDLGAVELATLLSDRFSAPALLGSYSRLVLDLNRTPHGEGSIPEASDGVLIPGNQNLGAAAIRTRVEALYTPYHRALSLWLEARLEKEAAPALIAIHSFTPALSLHFTKAERPWEIGVLWNHDPRLAKRLIEALSAYGNLCVGDNKPYTGRMFNHTLDVQAGALGIPHVAIEVRNDLLNTPEGVARWADILETALRPILDDPDLYRVEHYG